MNNTINFLVVLLASYLTTHPIGSWIQNLHFIIAHIIFGFGTLAAAMLLVLLPIPLVLLLSFLLDASRFVRQRKRKPKQQQFFYLYRLPTEIRQMIWEHLITNTDRVPIQLWYDKPPSRQLSISAEFLYYTELRRRPAPPTGWSFWPGDATSYATRNRALRLPSSTTASLLLTNRRIFKEVNPLLIPTRAFHLTTPIHAFNLTASSVFPGRQLIRVLTIDLSITSDGLENWVDKLAPAMTRCMPGVQKLTIRVGAEEVLGLGTTIALWYFPVLAEVWSLRKAKVEEKGERKLAKLEREIFRGFLRRAERVLIGARDGGMKIEG